MQHFLKSPGHWLDHGQGQNVLSQAGCGSSPTTGSVVKCEGPDWELGVGCQASYAGMHQVALHRRATCGLQGSERLHATLAYAWLPGRQALLEEAVRCQRNCLDAGLSAGCCAVTSCSCLSTRCQQGLQPRHSRLQSTNSSRHACCACAVQLREEVHWDPPARERALLWAPGTVSSYTPGLLTVMATAAGDPKP